VIRILLIFLTALVSLSSEMQGSRNIKVGDKLPATEALSVFSAGQKKLILVLNSGRETNQAFFRELGASVQTAEDLELYLVDTAPEPDAQLMSVFEAMDIEKKYIADVDKKIFGELGIIVQPTLLFLTEENILFSLIAGYQSNLKLIFPSHLEGLMTGEAPVELARTAQAVKEERQVSGLLEQGFRLMISRNYELAQKTFLKALEIEPDEETASLGIGYAQMFMGQIDQSLQHFTELKEKTDSKRVQLGYYLCEVLKEPSQEFLEQLASLAKLEPQLFFVVFKVAEALDQAGKCEESKTAYRHAYEILLRMYRK
jgi:tetratricopeptide (TPR) repeat protein